MDAALRDEAKRLRSLGSEQAATRLINERPAGSYKWGDALVLIEHLSWRVADQLRLARHYLASSGYASYRPYEVVASFMSLKNLLQVIREVWPSNPEDRRLLRYHLSGVLQKYQTSEMNKALIETLLKD